MSKDGCWWLVDAGDEISNIDYLYILAWIVI